MLTQSAGGAHDHFQALLGIAKKGRLECNRAHAALAEHFKEHECV